MYQCRSVTYLRRNRNRSSDCRICGFLPEGSQLARQINHRDATDIDSRLTIKLILFQDLSRFPAQWQVSHNTYKVVKGTARLLQLAGRRLDVGSPWGARISGIQAERQPEQASDEAHLGVALRHIQMLQALLADQHVLLDRHLLEVSALMKPSSLYTTARAAHQEKGYSGIMQHDYILERYTRIR